MTAMNAIDTGLRIVTAAWTSLAWAIGPLAEQDEDLHAAAAKVEDALADLAALVRRRQAAKRG
jgi:hypothetical protein